MMELFTGNPLCWAMVAVGWFAFQQIWMLYLTRFDKDVQKKDNNPLMTPSVLVGALPLMGLLGTIMGLQHRDLPMHGVQFHPESIRSEHGHALLQNFLNEMKVPA